MLIVVLIPIMLIMHTGLMGNCIARRFMEPHLSAIIPRGGLFVICRRSMP